MFGKDLVDKLRWYSNLYSVTRKISLVAHPQASENRLLEKNGTLHAYVTAAADKGKANKAILKLLASSLNISASKLTLVQGESSNQKVYELKGAV